MTKTIQFKSEPVMWWKEYVGLKRNTIRLKDDDIRFQILNEWMEEPFELCVEIINRKTGDVFANYVTDVSVFKDYYIISW